MVLFHQNYLQMGDRLRDDHSQIIRQQQDKKNDQKMGEQVDDTDNLATYFMDAAAERKFSQILWDLFDKDFELEDTDRRIPEEADSLMDDDRTFLVNCLTGSPSFGYFHRRIAEMRRLLGREKTDFPDRRVYIWLTHILHWISCLQEACRPNSMIRKQDAQQLITAGERVFFGIPDSVQKSFSKHLVHVSAKNKQNQIGVWSREGGAHNSPGILCLRWCVLLLEALKNDYEQVMNWERGKKRVRDLVQSVIANSTNRRDPNTIHQLTACEQELWTLHHEEQDMVVRSDCQSSSELHSEVKEYLSKLSTKEMHMDFAVKEFGTTNAVGPYRDALLDSLLVRVEAHGYPGLSFRDPDDPDRSNSSTTASTTCPRRNKIRSRFFQALWKRSDVVPDYLKEDMFSMSQWKAWEVENDLEEMIEDDLEESPLSDAEKEEAMKKRYFSTARSLVHSLEDRKSALSLRVLGGTVPTDVLVRMSPEERANPIIQKEREAAMASAIAQRDLISDGCLRNDNKDNSPTPIIGAVESIPQPQAKPVEDIFDEKPPPVASLQNPTLPAGPPALGMEKTLKRRGSDTSVSENEKPPAKLHKISMKELLSRIASSPEKSPETMTIQLPEEKLGAMDSSTVLDSSDTSLVQEKPTPSLQKLSVKQILSKIPVKPSPAAPAPPREVVTTNNQVSKKPIDKSRSRTPGTLIQHIGGGKLFRFTFKRAYEVDFEAFLDRVEDDDFVANNYFPQAMQSSGSCTIEETQEFLGSKLKKPRYSYYVLRVKLEESQEAQYKKFYRKFETIKKIPYFKLGEKEKAFLVTPKFHSCVKAVSFPRPNASYLVGIKGKSAVVVNLL